MPIPYLKPARGEYNQFWRYAVTLFAILWFSLGAGVIVTLVVMAATGSTDITTYSDLTMLWLTMLPFPAALLALWGGLRLLHKRGMMSLLRPGGGFSWKKLLLSGGVWFLLAVVSDGVMMLLNPSNYTWSFNPKTFFVYLLPALILIPIQTSTEELITRGYLSQWMGRFSQKIWLPLILPAFIFMLLHGLNPEVSAYGSLLTLPVYLGIGLLLGWVTLKSGGLEMALGLHVANNYYASLIVTFQSSALTSPALFSIKTYNPLLALVSQFVLIGIYLVIFYVFKPGWLNPKKPADQVSSMPVETLPDSGGGENQVL